jgi:hypothetical protein
MVLLSGSKVHRKSTAELMIAKRLDGLWPLLAALLVFPGRCPTRSMTGWEAGAIVGSASLRCAGSHNGNSWSLLKIEARDGVVQHGGAQGVQGAVAAGMALEITSIADIPMYNQDVFDAGMPEPVKRIRAGVSISKCSCRVNHERASLRVTISARRYDSAAIVRNGLA